MRITFRIEGGLAAFPGLARPSTLETDSLPPAERAELEALVRAAHFFDLPAQVGGAAGARDVRTYVVRVEDHEVAATEPLGDPALERLVSAVRARQRGPV